MTHLDTTMRPDVTGAAGHAPHVIIIGGGASGTLMAAQLLSRTDASFYVSIVETRDRIGLGLAYSTSDDGHLLNTRVRHMSAIAGQPDHLRSWLAGRGVTSDPEAFISRQTYGAYLSDLLAPWQQGEDRRRLRLVTATCVGLAEHLDGVSARLDDGTTLVGELAILATGHSLPRPVPGAILSDPWDPPPETHGTVAILGTGLTMVDHVITLLDRGHRGSILALSRRGLLPRVHAPNTPWDLTPADLPAGLRPSALVAAIRRLVRRAEQRGGTWRDAVDALRPKVRRIWRGLTPADRARLLRHALPFWDVHRHRSPPEVAERIARARASGQLQLMRGSYVGAERLDRGIDLAWRPHGATEVRRDTVARLVDCRGLRRDPLRDASPVIRDLIARGAARIDPLSIGLDVDADCRLLRADGSTTWRIRAVGPVTRAAFWEITALPDIREQAARLAGDLAELARRTDPGPAAAQGILALPPDWRT